MQHLRHIIGVTAAMLVMVGSSAAMAQEDQVVGTVNGQPILGSELKNELVKRWGEIALGGLMQELAIAQAAAEADVTVAEEEVEERADNFQRNLDMQAPITGNSFSLWLARQKMTPYAFRKWVRNELLLERMVEQEAKVTDDEVRRVWEASREHLRQPERMEVSHICVKTREEAARIRAEIIGGKPFEEAASEYSIDPYTKDKGGQMGPITRGESPFQAAAFALMTDGELSDPVRSQMGFHIIRRDEHIPAKVPEFDDVEEQLRDRIHQQKLMNLINEKRSEIMQGVRIEHGCDLGDLVQ